MLHPYQHSPKREKGWFEPVKNGWRYDLTREEESLLKQYFILADTALIKRGPTMQKPIAF
ncbi:hypothetical protein [Aeromonas salmonicida]|uniref:hypothetical protein n=1 Tax=Aeromonas salmonicida TaxID=645 RepID=UPI002240E060|nr:hypothetical protein [Aeromonas salmonicida]MDF8331184.1 hypothetical protein [Aeromonas salmonicida]MDM5134431.1 hypothetical protein [Aeromonas salmonicida]WHF42429.1 hypothetical protein QJ050_06585 [Aeromonas salmonicida]